MVTTAMTTEPTSNTYTSLINRRAQEERERKRKEQERVARENLFKLQTASTIQAGKPRKRKGLNFHEPGKFVSQAEQLRKKAKLEALRAKVAAAKSKTGLDEDVKLASLTTNIAAGGQLATSAPNNKRLVAQEIPDVEWWDKPILKSRSLDQVVFRLNQVGEKPDNLYDGITKLVEHPIIPAPPGPDPSKVQMPIFLTKAEKKKQRRRNRREAQLEKQEKIKLGLTPRPEPKLTHKNIIFALGEEAAVDPSRVDQMVQAQVEERLQAHIEHNESKKLTPEERRAKNLQRVQEDLSVTGIFVTIYRIKDLSSELHKIKITKNARQLTMTGVMVLHKDINVVVVEGGPKQQRRFKHLMLDRIKWDGESSDTAEPSAGNRCLLVWEGGVRHRSFKKFNVRPMTKESEIRELFKKSNVEHYWDLAYKTSILESIEEPLR